MLAFAPPLPQGSWASQRQSNLQKRFYTPHDNADCLPLHDLKDNFRLFILAREFATHRGGYIDLLGVDADGEVYIIETKLDKNADKRRILQAADRCTKPGELGALMRREGVYSSSLSTWRRQRDAADLAALAPQKRGPKIDPSRADGQQIAQLMRDNERLKSRLDKALLVIEDRGRDARYRAPPAQIRTCPIRAYGSYLECLTAKRSFGQG